MFTENPLRMTVARHAQGILLLLFLAGSAHGAVTAATAAGGLPFFLIDYRAHDS